MHARSKRLNKAVLVLIESCAGATFGKDPKTGNWATLKGAHFEGALLASSDIIRMCENPTLEEKTKKFELGCRVSQIKGGGRK